MARIAYYRVSTSTQSIEAQRSAMAGPFDKEFKDEGVGGHVLARDRDGFAEMMAYVREADTLYVYAIDRLGRDAIDIQQTVRLLREKGVALDVKGLGVISGSVGDLIVAILAQIAEMERAIIRERTAAGRELARKQLDTDGTTQNGAKSLGRPPARDAAEVRAWRKENDASLLDTAKHFGISLSTVKRYLSSSGPIAADRRHRFEAPLGDGAENAATDPVSHGSDCLSPRSATPDVGREVAEPFLPDLPSLVGPLKADLYRAETVPTGDEMRDVDVPAPASPDDRAQPGVAEGTPQLSKKAPAVLSSDMQPRRGKPAPHGSDDTSVVGGGDGGTLPIEGAVGIDGQMALPFDVPKDAAGQ
ncbi:recombinase family protein [Sphingomonas sp. NY01]|uniref:recombinase family protein n=1 Tax=Sphingomonas sp. NY01 TaxID=2968057 RepID=UPI00315DB66D